MKKIRVGLNKTWDRPLLHTVYGVPRDENSVPRERTATAKGTSKHSVCSPAVKMKEDNEDLTRLPDDSDDEYQAPFIPDSLYEAIDEPTSRQADIKPSDFRKGKSGSTNEGAKPLDKRVSERKSRSLRDQHVPLSTIKSQDNSLPRKRGRGNTEPSSQQSEGQNQGSQFTNEAGLLQKPLKGKGAKRGYGKSSTKPVSRKEPVSPNQSFKKAPTSSSSPISGTPKREFKQYKIPDTPISGDGVKFREPNVNDFVDESPTSSPFKLPKMGMLESSPLKNEASSFRIPNIPDMYDSYLEDSLQLPDIVSSPELPRGMKRTFKSISQSLDPEMDLNFVVEDLIQIPHAGMSTSTRREALEELSFEDLPPAKLDVRCPMCGDVVDTEHLKYYNDGKKMNIRTQAKFCHAHKKRSAKTEYTKLGYPVIDWDKLDARMSQHHTYLRSLLDGENSYYRNILEENVKSGKNRTLKQSMFSSNGQSLTPGYYGGRGLRAMSENIMGKFSPVLRRIAVTDRLVSARGVTGYVQSVLVQELAVKLIGEDMDLGTERARRVLEDSARLGDLLNDEVEEVIVRRVEGEDEDGGFA